MAVMEFIVEVEGREPLLVSLGGESPGEVRWERSLADLEGRRCQDCQCERNSRTCTLAHFCVNVFLYFSDLLSTERVEMRCRIEEAQMRLTLTAQRAAAVVMLYCMIFSGCEFLAKYKPMLRNYGVMSDARALVHMVVSTHLILALRQGGCMSESDLLGRLEAFSATVQTRLDCVYSYLERMTGNDSLRNGFQILYSVFSLTGDQALDILKNMEGAAPEIERL